MVYFRDDATIEQLINRYELNLVFLKRHPEHKDLIENNLKHTTSLILNSINRQEWYSVICQYINDKDPEKALSKIKKILKEENIPFND